MNQKKVRVNVGDWVRAVENHSGGTTKGLVYRVIQVDEHYWYTFNDRGIEARFQNPLSMFFELSKNTVVKNIINDL